MRESTGRKRGFRPGPGRLNFAERLIGCGVFVLLTFLFCVLYLPGASSAQRAKDNAAGVIYETENYTGGQEGKNTGKVSQASKENTEALKNAGGNKTKAAEILGMTRTKLYRKLKSL